MKDEKNKIKACDDLDGGSDEMAEENLNSGKEKMKTLGTRIYSLRILLEEFMYFFLLVSQSANNSPFSSELEFCIPRSSQLFKHLVVA